MHFSANVRHPIFYTINFWDVYVYCIPKFLYFQVFKKYFSLEKHYCMSVRNILHYILHLQFRLFSQKKCWLSGITWKNRSKCDSQKSHGNFSKIPKKKITGSFSHNSADKTVQTTNHFCDYFLLMIVTPNIFHLIILFKRNYQM